jgi:hypothetical protein
MVKTHYFEDTKLFTTFTIFVFELLLLITKTLNLQLVFILSSCTTLAAELSEKAAGIRGLTTISVEQVARLAKKIFLC